MRGTPRSANRRRPAWRPAPQRGRERAASPCRHCRGRAGPRARRAARQAGDAQHAARALEAAAERASAASITCVSSESSRSCTSVVPALRPASSSTRLEMLFEPAGAPCRRPGRRGRSRKRVVYIGGRVARRQRGGQGSACPRPCASRRAPFGGLRSGLRAPRRCLASRARGIERMAEALRLLEHLFAVRHQDVAPDGRIAGGDAREVAEARAGQREEVTPAGWLTTGESRRRPAGAAGGSRRRRPRRGSPASS